MPVDIKRLRFRTIDDVVRYRARRRMTQTAFWERIGVTRFTASRRESHGSSVPALESLLLTIAYGTELQAAKVLTTWRNSDAWQSCDLKTSSTRSFLTGKDVVAFRQRHGYSQTALWGEVHVLQPCGSRYESGRRTMSEEIRMALGLAFGSDHEAAVIITRLRQNWDKDDGDALAI